MSCHWYQSLFCCNRGRALQKWQSEDQSWLEIAPNQKQNPAAGCRWWGGHYGLQCPNTDQTALRAPALCDTRAFVHLSIGQQAFLVVGAGAFSRK